MGSSYDKLQDYVLDNGYLPTPIIRIGIRRQLAQRVAMNHAASATQAYETKMKYLDLLRSRPIAIETAKANQQHYEVDTGVLKTHLGPRMKYSCCYYKTGKETLGQAEVDMMKLYVERAGIADGMDILDLGCGWGSLSIYLAELFPKATIHAFSNSATQKEYIDATAASKGLKNLTVITGDVANHEFERSRYDRVVSIELFEHMKNYERLMQKVSNALRPGGKLFVHLFAHKDSPYDFEDGWMTDNFFTGGTMPSADLLLYFQKHLSCERQWWVSGQHYQHTCEDWFSKMTAAKKEMWPSLVKTYGEDKALMWYHRWQIFYLACSELFGWNGGDDWGICHYLFVKPESRD